MVVLKRYIPALFVLIWSTGFIGAKYILPFAEPFVFLSIRYFFATISLLLLAKALGESLKISWPAIKQSIVVAIFLHVIYIGGVFYAINIGVSAGIAAVIVSLQPILVSILAIPFLGERLVGFRSRVLPWGSLASRYYFYQKFSKEIFHQRFQRPESFLVFWLFSAQPVGI